MEIIISSKTNDLRTANKVIATTSPVNTQDAAWAELSSLFVKVESKSVKMSVNTGVTLRTLVTQAYDANDSMVNWWAKEFMKLPGWLNY
jgi:hypothetical protein